MMWGLSLQCSQESQDSGDTVKSPSPSLLDPCLETEEPCKSPSLLDSCFETGGSYKSPSLLHPNSGFSFKEYKLPPPRNQPSFFLPKPSDIQQSAAALLEDFENSLDVLKIIPEDITDTVDYVKKKTADVTSAVVEEAVVKKLLQPYVDRHNVNEKTIPLLAASSHSRNIRSVSVPGSPSDLEDHLENKRLKLCNLTAVTTAENRTENTLKRSICFGKLYRMVAALSNEKGPRREAPYFIRSLCQGIMDVINITMDVLTDENEKIIIQAAALITDLANKDLDSPNLGFSMEDTGIVTLIKCIINCIEDSAYISKHGGVRNNFVHEMFKTLIISEKIRTVIFENLCHAIRCSFSRFYNYLVKRSGTAAVIPTVELDGLFYYFQILTAVILCSSEDPWMDESDILKLKTLEKIAMTKVPLNLVSIYMTRITTFAIGKQKNQKQLE